MVRTELWHVAASHFPIAFLVSAALLYPVAHFIKADHRWKPSLYLLYRFLLYFGAAFATINLFLGDEAATIVNMELCDRSVLYDHEDFAHYLVYLSVFLVVSDLLSLGLRENLPRWLHLLLPWIFLALNFGNAVLVWRTSSLGGELVYEQGAAVSSADCRTLEQYKSQQN